MGKCVIFCAGTLDTPVEPLSPGDLLIAADGGLRHTEALGLKPDAILGDFDSLGYVPAGARVFPVKKDDTDMVLAVRMGLARGFREFLLYGCLGGPRLDHTVAALQTLLFLAERGAVGYLSGGGYLVTAVKNGALTFSPAAKGIVSVFCLGQDARGVCLEGLEYPLKDAVLTAGFPLGVSNHFTGTRARLSVGDGSLLILWDRENGFPERSDLG